jgi:hypothetical protein
MLPNVLKPVFRCTIEVCLVGAERHIQLRLNFLLLIGTPSQFYADDNWISVCAEDVALWGRFTVYSEALNDNKLETERETRATQRREFCGGRGLV